MADASNGSKNGSDRLDSWKVIAAYLKRDERTVRRWELERGLPIRRVPGGRGTSVFAYAAEIDDWLKTAPPAAPLKSTERPRGLRLAMSIAALVIIGVLGVVTWRLRSNVAAEALRIEATSDGVVAYDRSGQQRWRYSFSPAHKTVLADGDGSPAVLVPNATPAAFVATSFRARHADGQIESGSLIELGIDGRPQREFTFTDELTINGVNNQGPWAIAAFSVDDSQSHRRIAVAAHHHTWGTSLVTILDADWRRQGTFVHAGWIESVRWLPDNRLLVGGYSDEHEGGMVGLLDPNALTQPLRMTVMPRTELNRVTMSRFNRAVVQVLPDSIVARPIEVPSAGQDAVDVVYEFTPQLDFKGAAFSVRYWELHRALEAQGLLRHSRDTCPDRHGPRTIKTWSPAQGWQVIAIS